MGVSHGGFVYLIEGVLPRDEVMQVAQTAFRKHISEPDIQVVFEEGKTLVACGYTDSRWFWNRVSGTDDWETILEPASDEFSRSMDATHTMNYAILVNGGGPWSGADAIAEVLSLLKRIQNAEDKIQAACDKIANFTFKRIP